MDRDDYSEDLGYDLIDGEGYVIGDEDGLFEEEGMDGGDAVIGYGEDGLEEVVGRGMRGRMRGAGGGGRRRRGRGRRGRGRGRGRMRAAPPAPERGMIALPQRPAWREGMVSPGVVAPYQGLEPLPMSPEANNGVFDDTTPSILFRGQPQRPFRSERLLVDIRRSAGATAIRILSQAIFVGTSLQQADVGTLSLDFFVPNAFGVRLSLMQAQPGMLVRMIVNATPAVPAGESVGVDITLLGHTIAA